MIQRDPEILHREVSCQKGPGSRRGLQAVGGPVTLSTVCGVKLEEGLDFLRPLPGLEPVRSGQSGRGTPQGGRNWAHVSYRRWIHSSSSECLLIAFFPLFRRFLSDLCVRLCYCFWCKWLKFNVVGDMDHYFQNFTLLEAYLYLVLYCISVGLPPPSLSPSSQPSSGCTSSSMDCSALSVPVLVTNQHSQVFTWLPSTWCFHHLGSVCWMNEPLMVVQQAVPEACVYWCFSSA